jgi:hypothetical protein
MTRPDEFGRFRAYQAWTFSPPPGVDVRVVSPVQRGNAYGGQEQDIASYGKVLGNRTTLYKYVNPRMTALVLAAASPRLPPGAHPACEVVVLDAGKGTVLYRRTIPTAPVVPGSASARLAPCDVKVALSENWLVYHYYDAMDEREFGAKGWRIVSVEMYEGKGVDEKTGR